MHALICIAAVFLAIGALIVWRAHRQSERLAKAYLRAARAAAPDLNITLE